VPHQPDVPQGALSDAVAELRHVSPREFTGAAVKEKADKLDAAWETLIAAGDKGAQALLAEVAALEAAGEQDDYFRLGAATILWKLQGLERAADVVRVWTGVTDFSVNFNYVFETAFEAAQTGDARAVEMLRAMLRDRKGSYFLVAHAMDVEWPLTHVFLWGVLGRRATEPLMEALEHAEDADEQLSAMAVLRFITHELARATLRRLSQTGAPEVRRRAIAMLGDIGHPDDWDFLVAGLQDEDPGIAFAHASALFEYEDLRAVPALLAVADSDDDRLRGEVLVALGHLPTPEGLGKLGSLLPKADAQVRFAFENQVMPALRSVDLTWKAFSAMTEQDQRAALALAREAAEEEYALQEDDRELSHAELLKAAEDWIARHRITGGDYEWVETRHVLAAATPADVPLLLDVRGACFTRLSDECLDEAQLLDRILLRVVRSGYRREPGLCERVEAPAKSAR
jgi:hypothetical protein